MQDRFRVEPIKIYIKKNWIKPIIILLVRIWKWNHKQVINKMLRKTAKKAINIGKAQDLFPFALPQLRVFKRQLDRGTWTGLTSFGGLWLPRHRGRNTLYYAILRVHSQTTCMTGCHSCCLISTFADLGGCWRGPTQIPKHDWDVQDPHPTPRTQFP